MAVFFACSLIVGSVQWSDDIQASDSHFDTSEADAYPAHLAGFFDLASVDLINLATVHNRLSLFEPSRLSLHGFSWTSLRYQIDGVHSWHPLMDGQPIVAISSKRYGGLSLLRGHGDLPVIAYRSDEPRLGRRFVSEITLPLTGTTLLPHGFMDREPALPTSTPRRQENFGYRLALVDGYQDSAWRTEVGVELNQSDRQFPTLLDEETRLLEESAWIAQGDALVEHLESGLEVRILGSQQVRPHHGAEYRFSANETSELKRSEAAVFVNQRLRQGLHWSASIAFAQQEHLRELTLPSRDLAAEWMQLQRRIRAHDEEGLSFTAQVSYEHELFGEASALKLEVGERAWVRSLSNASTLWDSVVWNNGSETLPISLAVRDRGDRTSGEQGYFEAIETWSHLAASRRYALSLGSVTQWVQAQSSQSWLAMGLKFGALASFELSESMLLNLGFGTVPQPASKSLVEFLDDGSPSGNYYRWDDDGDLTAQSNETGEVLRRFGGAFHQEGLSGWMPHHLTLTLGIGENRKSGYFWYWQGTANLLVGQGVVSFDPSTLAQFEATEIVEPGGDGLGEDGRLETGGQALTVYARNGETGSEYYQLTHSDSLAQFWGMSLEFGFDEPNHPWMWRVAGTAYLSLAETPFGIFSDRNDVGLVDEASADPNAQVNRDGRSDACRAFGVNIDFRYRVNDSLRWFLSGRYRDGQPFTRIWVEESLPQGPVAVMAVGRGDPVPRFTFHMTLDTAIDWSLGRFWGGSWYTNLRVTNLLNSGTELLEELRTGDSFRKSLEMVPTRSVWLTLRLES